MMEWTAKIIAPQLVKNLILEMEFVILIVSMKFVNMMVAIVKHAQKAVLLDELQMDPVTRPVIIVLVVLMEVTVLHLVLQDVLFII